MSALANWSLPVAAIVISDYVALRWLIRLSNRTDELRERLARLEGRLNGRDGA